MEPEGHDIYITITEKGDDVSEKLLRDLIANEEFANLNKTMDSDESFKVKKGVKFGVGLQRVEKRLAEKISEQDTPIQRQALVARYDSSYHKINGIS